MRLTRICFCVGFALATHGWSSAQTVDTVGAQHALKERRFYAGAVDGKQRPEWNKALQDFQRWEGLPETGNLDRSTLDLLRRIATPQLRPAPVARAPVAAPPRAQVAPPHQPPSTRSSKTAPPAPLKSQPSSPADGVDAEAKTPPNANGAGWLVTIIFAALAFTIWRRLRLVRPRRQAPSSETIASSQAQAPDPVRAPVPVPPEPSPQSPATEGDQVLSQRVESYEAALNAIYGGALSRPHDGISEEVSLEPIEELPTQTVLDGDEGLEQDKWPPLKTSGEWLPAGRSVALHDRIIEGGMFYFGRALRRQYGGGDENCLVNPDLKIAVRGDTSARLDYWPSYAQLSPASRKAYLDWLGGSRDDPETNIGYVFLYLYGLERRLLLDNPGTEESIIVKEVRRLLNIYGSNHSFHRYAVALLEAVAVRSGEPSIGISISEPSGLDVSSNFGEIPLALRVALGMRARDGQAIEPDLLLAFVLAHPETRVRTPARRALPELRLLFDAAAQRAFPNGARFSRAGRARRLELHYRAASGSFEVPILSKEQGLPDVSGLSEPITTARRLLDACTDQLDAFSREIGRAKGLKPTLAAVARLPAEVRIEAAQALSDSPLVRLAELAEKGAPVDPKTFAERLGLPEPVRADTGQLREWARMLAAFGYGITADPQFALRRRRESEAFVVFLLVKPVDILEPPTEAFRFTQAAVALGVAAALADGNLDARERDTLSSFIDAAPGLHDDERRRLRAEIIMQAADPFTLSELRSRLKQTPSETRSEMADHVIKVATADGRVEPSEVTFIEKMFRHLDLDTSDLYSRLNAPIATTRNAQQSREESSNSPLATSPGSLDFSRLASIRAETAAAASLLSAIFADDEPEVSAGSIEAVEPLRSDADSDSGLDQRHHSLLLLLADREEWPRRDFEKMVRSVDLMPGAVLETLNDWALDRHDELLLEGDDPISVNQNILSTDVQQVSV